MSGTRKRKKDKFDLESEVAALRLYIEAFRTEQDRYQKRLDAEELAKATDKAKAIFLIFKEIAARSNVQGLEPFLNEAIAMTNDLHKISETEKGHFAKPNEFMVGIIKAFEKFTSSVATKETRERMRRAVSFIPVIDGVVTACGGIPFYFEHGNRYEKAAMILCAVLLLTALAMTIAIYASPAIAGIPVLAPAIAGCVLASRMLYDQAAKNARKQYADKPIVTAANAKLGELGASMEEYKRGEFAAKVDADLQGMARTEASMLKFTDDTFTHYGHKRAWTPRSEVRSGASNNAAKSLFRGKLDRT